MIILGYSMEEVDDISIEDTLDEFDKAWASYMRMYYTDNKQRINMRRRMNYAKEHYGIPYNLYHKFAEHKAVYKQIYKDIEHLDLHVIHSMFLHRLLIKELK